MEYDDRIRSVNGLVICLRDMGNGTSRLFFDDVRGNQEANPIAWSYQTFYTFTSEFENAALDSMALFPSQFEQIGAAVVARLLASNGRASIEEADDPPLDGEDEAAVAALEESDVATIDRAILSRCDQRWRKVAYVVGFAMADRPQRLAGIPDRFYAMRVRALVEAGVLEAQGNLQRMRFSEVRIRAEARE